MKPRAAFTVPVSARVSVELKQWLLDGAAAHQLSLCEYGALLLGLAAGRHEELDQLRQQQLAELQEQRARQLQQQQEADRQLAAQQAQFAWYAGTLRAQLSGALENLSVLRRLHEQFGEAPIPVSLAQQQGFVSAYLLTTLAIDGQRYYAVGDYAWRYQTPSNTHLLVRHYGHSTA